MFFCQGCNSWPRIIGVNAPQGKGKRLATIDFQWWLVLFWVYLQLFLFHSCVLLGISAHQQIWVFPQFHVLGIEFSQLDLNQLELQINTIYIINLIYLHL